MSDELALANTPQNLGVTPRYVLQHNAISRSAHNMSATAKKLTVMAMALLPHDMSSLTSAFTFTDFCKAIGFGDGGEQYRLFTDAVEECLKTVISIETGKVIKGKKSWEKFTWFEYAKFNAETGVCAMRFSRELADFVTEFKKVYAKINLGDIGRMQSKYAIRLFEIAKSYESLAGKDGNPPGSWYFERSVEELRLMLGIPDNIYAENKRFSQKVIKEPVKELNNAGVGVKIETESIKKGRSLAGIRFNCQEAPRTTPKKRGRPRKEADSQQELPLEDERTARDRKEKELEHLKELYPMEYAELYVGFLKEMPALPGNVGDSFRQTAADLRAKEALRDKYGIRK